MNHAERPLCVTQQAVRVAMKSSGAWGLNSSGKRLVPTGGKAKLRPGL